MLLPNARTIDVREIYGLARRLRIQVSRMIYGIGARDKCIQLSPSSNCFVSRNHRPICCAYCWKVIDELTWEYDSWTSEWDVSAKQNRSRRSIAVISRESDRHVSKQRCKKAATSVTYRSIVLVLSNEKKSPEIRIVTLVWLHSTQADSCIVRSLWIQIDTMELIARALRLLRFKATFITLRKFAFLKQ